MFIGLKDTVVGQDYAIKLKTKVINRWLTFLGKRKQIPVGVFVEYDNGALRWLFLEDIPFREPVK